MEIDILTNRAERHLSSRAPQAPFRSKTMSAIASIQKTTVLKLDFPIEYQGASIADLKIRRAKGKDMRFLPKNDEQGVEGMFPFYSLICGCEEGVFDEMDASDIVKLSEVVEGFLPKAKKARR